MFSSIRRVFRGGTPKTPRRPRPARVVLHLEVLEERTLPDASPWGLAPAVLAPFTANAGIVRPPDPAPPAPLEVGSIVRVQSPNPPAAPQSRLPVELQDAGLRAEVGRLFTRDRAINHNGMLDIFEHAQKGGPLTPAKMEDLRALVRHGDRLGMPENVRVLAEKVVKADPANFASEVGRHFKGEGRPSTTTEGTNYEYARAQGSLFGPAGPQYTDVRQGNVNNCYLKAAMAGMARVDPQMIRNLFRENPNGTYDVRFWNSQAQKFDWVNVGRHLPVEDGHFVFGNAGRPAGDANNVLWPALLEKAYAKWNGSGGPARGQNTNSYQGIAWGRMHEAVFHLTGWQGEERTPTNTNADFQKVAQEFPTAVVGFGSKATPNAQDGISPNHTYTLIGVNTTQQTVTLFNPVGGGQVTLTWAKVAENFDAWYVNRKP